MEILSRPQTIFLLFLWVFPHILLIRIAIKGYCKKTLIVCMVSLVVVVTLKPATFDLPKYSVYLASGYLAMWPYEYVDGKDLVLDSRDSTGIPFSQAYRDDRGFALLAKGLNKIFPVGPYLPRLSVTGHRFISDFQVLGITILGLVAILIASLVIFSKCSVGHRVRKTIVYCLPILMGSVFFIIGSQNVLRQFLGVCFVLVAISLFSRKLYLLSIIAIALAISFHHWSLVFGLYSVGVVVIINLMANSNSNYQSNTTLWRNYCLGLIVGIGMVITIKIIIGGGLDSLGFIETVSSNFTYIGELKQYVFKDSSALLSRTDPLTKLILVGTILIISELIMGSSTRSSIIDIRSFRAVTYVSLVPLAIYPELMSRVLFFYFAIEALFMCWAFMSTQRRVRLAGWVVLMGNGFAINSINVLIGGEWLYTMT